MNLLPPERSPRAETAILSRNHAAGNRGAGVSPAAPSLHLSITSEKPNVNLMRPMDSMKKYDSGRDARATVSAHPLHLKPILRYDFPR
jgi:hypothetical protein